jgi:hypothetical protein
VLVLYSFCTGPPSVQYSSLTDDSLLLFLSCLVDESSLHCIVILADESGYGSFWRTD